MTICDGCWTWGDAAHVCEKNFTQRLSDGDWIVPCVCQVERACYGNQNGIFTRTRVEAEATAS